MVIYDSLGRQNMSMNVDNSLINARSFLTDNHLADAKKVKFGDTTSDIAVMSGQINENIINNLDDKRILDLSLAFSNVVPELKQPPIDNNGSTSNQGLHTMADKLTHLLAAFDGGNGGESAKGAAKADSGYKKVNEHAFAALYSELLELFSSLNMASSKLTGTHAKLAEKLAESGADKLIQAAVSQKNQVISMGVTSMAMGGVGLALSHKGINQQREAVKQSAMSQNLNDVNRDINNSVTNGSNLNKLSEPSNENVGTSILNNQRMMEVSNDKQFELLKLQANKKTNTGQTVSGMGQHAGNLVSSGYGVESATENAGSQLDNVAKDNMIETEVKNREGQNAARANLKALLDLIYQSIEKNNDAISHTAQMLKV